MITIMYETFTLLYAHHHTIANLHHSRNKNIALLYATKDSPLYNTAMSKNQEITSIRYITIAHRCKTSTLIVKLE